MYSSVNNKETPPIVGGDSLLTRLVEQRATGALQDIPESTYALLLAEALRNQDVKNKTQSVPYAAFLKSQKFVPIIVSDHLCKWVEYYYDGSTPVITKDVGVVIGCGGPGGVVKVFLKPGLNTVPESIAMAYKLYEKGYMEPSALEHYVRTVNHEKYNQYVVGDNGLTAPRGSY